MISHRWFRVAIVSLIALLAGLLSVHAQRRGFDVEVQTGTPTGLFKKVDPESV